MSTQKKVIRKFASLSMEERLRRVIVPPDFFPKAQSNTQPERKSESRGRKTQALSKASAR